MFKKMHYKSVRSIIKRTLRNGQPWPEDKWISVAPNRDLNLWDNQGQKRADTYPVVRGETKTDTWKTVEVSNG